MKKTTLLMKNMMSLVFLGMSIFCAIPALCAPDNNFRDCIILVNGRFPENIFRSNFYLMSRLQSAIQEQAVPILLDASLWNAFIERRLSTEQLIAEPDSRAQKVYDLSVRLNERITYWSNYYNGISADAIHNKALVVQQINKEFYSANNRLKITDVEHFILLNYETHFDPEEWLIYKNNGGFYLLIPKKYHAQHAQTGFRLEILEEVLYPLDNGRIYFESQHDQSLVDALPDFFLTHGSDNSSSFMWNIVLSGHGDGDYQEFNENGKITWKGEPIIANVSLEEFNGILAFFDEQVETHFLHYTSCYAGGNHSKLVFGNDGKKTYNFVLLCGVLTDCMSYCKWAISLPSPYKHFLTCDDLRYNKAQKSWYLPLAFEYRWQYFFNKIASIDFSTGSMERLIHILPAITRSTIADIPLICMPHTQIFYPLHGSTITKVDSRLLETTEEQKENAQILLQGQKVLLLESTYIVPTIQLDQTDSCRFISVQSGCALHYIKKLKASFHIDLPTAFWRAENQQFDKTFILDECTFPNDINSLIFKNVGISNKELLLKNVIILKQRYSGIRIFFTIDDEAIMILARKPTEDNVSAMVLSVTQLSAAAKETYNQYYDMLKHKADIKTAAAFATKVV